MTTAVRIPDFTATLGTTSAGSRLTVPLLHQHEPCPLLLVGKVGTGKTVLANQIAGQAKTAGVEFYHCTPLDPAPTATHDDPRQLAADLVRCMQHDLDTGQRTSPQLVVLDEGQRAFTEDPQTWEWILRLLTRCGISLVATAPAVFPDPFGSCAASHKWPVTSGIVRFRSHRRDPGFTELDRLDRYGHGYLYGVATSGTWQPIEFRTDMP